jgi:hypothetical protein
MNDAGSERTDTRWGRYLFLVGIVLISALGWYFGVGRLAGLIRGAAPGPLLGMAALIVAGFWIRAWKWHVALGHGRQGILLFFLAKTAGNWTPGRAGELAPLLLKRHRNVRVAAWIGLDRAVEVAWTLGLGLAGAVGIGLTPSGVVLGLVVVVTVLLVLTACLLLRSGHLVGAFSLTERWPRFHALIGELLRELRLFGRTMWPILGLTALAKLTDIYAVILLCDAFGYDVSFLLVCAARCAHGLVSAIPITPDATGAPFVAAAVLLHAYAAIPYDTLTAALGLEVLVINAILWACFCVVSGIRWRSAW